MSQKNETTVLTLTILITLGLLGICFWLFSNKFNFEPGSINLNQPELTQQFNKVDTFSKVQNVPSGLFNYGGSTSWAPIRRDVDPIIQVSWLKFRLRYTQSISNIPGSGTAIKMLLNNQLAFRTGEYPITRRLFVIVKENGQVDQQAGLTYANLLLTTQGQDLLTKAGFVSLR
ncbi:MAG: hypothetical protein F6J89_14225 [Symploca sp. SIO1C4]|uniref:Phosphate ABC transporter substrate-binding protein n=1 Tax=Symploca sp. SIO1C4 TaxID=2607765 RepID=A0A6B3NDR0_9CYAN|nr:hypothetical protein [Symploca sp. SIO1C4]